MIKKKTGIEYNILFYVATGLLVLSIAFNFGLLSKDKSSKIKYVTDQNVVFLGDSITNGYNVSEFFPDILTINSGIGGNKTTDVLNRMKDSVYIYNPSKVLLLIGINDLNSGASSKDVLDNIQKIVNGIKLNRKYTKIYIESIYPVNVDYAKEVNNVFKNTSITNDEIKEINKKIKSLCKENDVTYINVYDSLVDENGNLKEIYTKEGLHLTDLGYYKVTKAIEKYVYE